MSDPAQTTEPIRVASVDEIPEGEAFYVDADITGIGEPIGVFHAEDGNFYALDDECTHGAASLSEGFIEGTEIECPLHSATFCLKTGAVTAMPATEDTRTHRVEVVDGEVLLYPTAD